MLRPFFMVGLRVSLIVGLFVHGSMVLAQEPMRFKVSGSDLGQNSAASSKATATSTESIKELAPRVTAENQALSIQNFVPAKGAPVLEVTPAYGTQSRDLQIQTLKYSTTTTGLVTELRWIGRLGQKTVLEVRNDFGSQDVDVSSRFTNSSTFKSSYRATGLGDFHVVARTFSDRGTGVLHFGADFGLNNGAAEWGNNTTDGNRSSGGTSISPFLSYETENIGTVLGWKAFLNIRNGRAIEMRSAGSRPFRFQETGGNVFAIAGFSEKNLGKAILGGKIQLSTTASSAWEGADASSVTFDPSQMLSFMGYFETHPMERMALIPSVSLQTLFGSAGNVEQQSNLNLGLAARMSL